MSLSLAQVIEKAGKQEMAYIQDGPVHYVVFTRADNTWNSERIANYLAVLDQIEASEGPGVMITLGTGKRHFSTGFDLPFWAAKVSNMEESILEFDEVMARLLQFSMPTMCIFNGTAYAGGLIWGLCHDYRIMNAKVGGMCLSELKLGLPLPLPYMLVCRAKMSPVVCTKWSLAITCDVNEGLKDGVIDDVYESTEDLEAKMKTFVKRFA